MDIIYNDTKKDLPAERLHHLFFSAGWAGKEHCPDSEWLVQTEKHISGYYEKMGFNVYKDVVLTVPSKYKCTD